MKDRRKNKSAQIISFHRVKAELCTTNDTTDKKQEKTKKKTIYVEKSFRMFRQKKLGSLLKLELPV